MKARLLFRLLLLALLSTGSLLGTGCASTEGEGHSNQSTRPWNQPRGWETGVPGMLQQDRRY